MSDQAADDARHQVNAALDQLRRIGSDILDLDADTTRVETELEELRATLVKALDAIDVIGVGAL